MVFDIDIATVTVRYTPIYKCNGCGVFARGSGRSVDFTNGVYSLSALRSEIITKTPNHYMPTGWAGFGNELHTCPSCLSSKTTSAVATSEMR